jgi:MFS family permease
MQTTLLKTLAVVSIIYFFTSNLSGMFLPVYFKELGLNLTEMIEIMLLTFTVIGLLPIVLLKLVKNFERIISLGIFLTMLFYIALIYIKNPVVLGLAYGLSVATFWPCFNLLQFRLSESAVRARTVSLFTMIIPSLSGVVSPAVGGFIIENFEFIWLFRFSIALYLIAFLLSTRIRFQSEIHGLSIPKRKMFHIFFITFIISGLFDSYWLVYPLFVHKISGTALKMGLVFTFGAILVSSVTFLVNWLSDIKKARIEFAIVGAILYFVWYFALAFASTMHEIVALSLLSGLASAFTLSWFAYYGDYFARKYYASILVMMEVGLMIGRLVSLLPTYIFISEENYQSYFILSGTFALFLVPFLILARETEKLVTNCNWNALRRLKLN